MATLNIMIIGKVQGVFFRASAKKKADEAGITGWVKNTLSGNVEIMCSGDDSQLNSFTKWCKTGPAAAEVDHVDVHVVPPQQFEGFTILR